MIGGKVDSNYKLLVNVSGDRVLISGQGVTVLSGTGVIIQSGLGTIIQSGAGVIVQSGLAVNISGQSVAVMSGTGVVVQSGYGVVIQSGTSVIAQQAIPSSILTGYTAIGNLSGGTQLSSGIITLVNVRSLPGNDLMWLGPLGVASGTGYLLLGGESESININNLNVIYLRAETSGNPVSYRSEV